MLINKETKEKIWEHEFKELYPETSFPTTFTNEILEDFNHAVLNYPAQPVPAVLEKVIDAGIEVIDSKYFQKWELQPLSPEEIQDKLNNLKQEIVANVQQRLDDFANTRNYDGILSACTYATSSVPKFAEEGQYCVEARDNTWSVLYSILADVEAGTRNIPSSYSEIELELPVLVWPN